MLNVVLNLFKVNNKASFCSGVLMMRFEFNTWIYFVPLVCFYTPGKHQEISGFLMFSGGIERDQWYEVG